MHGDAGSPSRYGEDAAPWGAETRLPKLPIEKIKAAPHGAAGPASAAASGLGGPGRRTPGHAARLTRSARLNHTLSQNESRLVRESSLAAAAA